MSETILILFFWSAILTGAWGDGGECVRMSKTMASLTVAELNRQDKGIIHHWFTPCPTDKVKVIT